MNTDGEHPIKEIWNNSQFKRDKEKFNRKQFFPLNGDSYNVKLVETLFNDLSLLYLGKLFECKDSMMKIKTKYELSQILCKIVRNEIKEKNN